ncbi:MULTISPECIES: hypothetical protein [unclassified Oleiphilus]|uniref:hypothetical protein n=1 Tax=unclassified Oleiphilus TaxID=2631174 RepID=UPI001E32E90E|nr:MULTISPECIES: hypothetical protein [unclassified Oleiphilus]
MMSISVMTIAGDREQAKRLHERIAGVPPSASDLDYMATQIGSGNADLAAERALEHKSFYNVTLKNFAAPWTNEAMDNAVPLNDYTATVIGLVLEERDFRTVLYDNVVYVGDASLGLTPYSNTDNDHYEELEASDASLKDFLVRTTQSSVNGLPSDATAGVMTTRAAAQAYFSGGTNRAMFRFTMLHHLCNDLEQVNDTTRPPDRIRQDVSRSPGGDSKIFLNNCIGCHAGMDPMSQSFAYYDYEYDAATDPNGLFGRMVYNAVGSVDAETGERVQGKYRINSTTFEYGYVTSTDQWDNYWREGQNSILGWDAGLSGTGMGAKSMGQELAHSEAFAQCQVKKVFENVCLRPPSDTADRNQVDSMVNSFKSSGYKLKQVFAESAVYCMGP